MSHSYILTLLAGILLLASVQSHAGLEEEVCRQRPEVCGGARPANPSSYASTPSSSQDVVDLYKQQQYVDRYGKVLIYRGCMQDLEACLVAISTYYRGCEEYQWSYLNEFTNDPIYRHIRDIQIRMEDGVKKAYVVFKNGRIERAAGEGPVPRPRCPMPYARITLGP